MTDSRIEAVAAAIARPGTKPTAYGLHVAALYVAADDEWLAAHPDEVPWLEPYLSDIEEDVVYRARQTGGEQ